MSRLIPRTVRARLTVATVVVVGLVAAGAAVGAYAFAQRSLIEDVRTNLADDLTTARDVLDRGVATELNLLALGIATDPLEQTGRIVEESCAGILAEAYGETARPFEDYYLLTDLDDVTYFRYDDCVFQSDPRTLATAECAFIAIDAIGNPTVTFTEYREIQADGNFDAAYDACVTDSLLVDTVISSAAQQCEVIVATAFESIDVLDEMAVATATDTALDEYVVCMRSNGVTEYPDISSNAAENGSVLSAVAGSGVVIPSVDSIRSSVTRFGAGLIVGVPLVVIALGALTWAVIGRALRPVESIRSRVSAITAVDLDQRVPEPGTDDEVARLAETMNDMLGRLESSAERQRQFVSDASHELRSPLASIRTQLEVALAHPDSAEWSTIGDGVLTESHRMERLVDDLLTLARADEGVVIGATSEVDVTDLVLQEATRTRRVPIDTSHVDVGRVDGDASAIRRALRNLFDNAARHAATRVTVALTENDAHVEVVVTDDGPGVPIHERERIFERFVRLQEGRARDEGGAGLGLAVVREIAVAHGGDVTATDAPGGGARFAIRLPKS